MAVNIIVFSLTLCFADCTNEMILEYENRCKDTCEQFHTSCIESQEAVTAATQGNMSVVNECNNKLQTCFSNCGDKAVEYQDNDCPGNEIDTGCNSTNCPN